MTEHGTYRLYPIYLLHGRSINNHRRYYHPALRKTAKPLRMFSNADEWIKYHKNSLTIFDDQSNFPFAVLFVQAIYRLNSSSRYQLAVVILGRMEVGPEYKNPFLINLQ